MGKKRERTPPDFGPLLNSLEQEAERAKNRPLHGEEHIQVIPLQRKSFMKNEAMSPMVSSKLSANFPSADGEKTEGSLLKHQLNTHRLEINRLRAVLDEKAQTEAEEKAQIQTLKKSLQKSLEYALKASEWQEMESAGLKKIVSELKVEVSSLMAHLLMGEEEKQRMRTDYNRMKMQVIYQQFTSKTLIHRFSVMNRKKKFVCWNSRCKSSKTNCISPTKII